MFLIHSLKKRVNHYEHVKLTTLRKTICAKVRPKRMYLKKYQIKNLQHP